MKQFNNDKIRRILIDGRFIGVGESMTRYCLELVKGILELDHKNNYTLLIRPIGKKIIQSSKFKVQNDNLKIKVLDIKHYSLSEQTTLLKYLNRERYDLVHFIQFNHPVRYKGKFVVSIHDLTLLGHLHRQRWHKRLAFGRVMRSAVKNSAKIITISETSKKDIIDYYGTNPDKIAVTYLGVDSAYNTQVKSQKLVPSMPEGLKVKSFKEKYGIVGNYILYTGMWKRHKNLLRMLKAFYKVLVDYRQHIPRGYSGQAPGHGADTAHSVSFRADLPAGGVVEGSLFNKVPDQSTKLPQLVLVGKIDKDEPEIMREIERINSVTKKLTPNAYQPIICTGYIDEADLPLAYAGALAYIIPSLSEGFGLPPLEAMVCGTPVLSSNISAMPEILGSAPLYFDPYDVEDMVKKIKMMIEDEELRAELSKKGIEQAAKYSWQNTAKSTLDIYKSCLLQ